MLIAPSLLAADLTCLAEEIRKISSADYLHIDIMDGIFVPNISLGPAIVHALRNKIDLVFDVHLMIVKPLKYIESFSKAGADLITFHIESDDNVSETISAIKLTGKKAGLAIKPATSVDALIPYAQSIDMVTVMTVEPGFGGQQMMCDMLEKVKILKHRYPHLLVEVDGGVNRNTAHLCESAGADILVAGTAIFRAENPAEEINFMRHSDI